MNKLRCNIATLGPKGTDSENAAAVLKDKLNLDSSICLFSSFKEAYEQALINSYVFLIPAAYVDCNNDQITQAWADFNFKIAQESILELWKAFIFPLKPLCLAQRKDIDNPESIALHPSVKYYLTMVKNDLKKKIFVNNKPTAVRLCSSGLTDLCFGSEDVINSYKNLQIIGTFHSKMCWTVYIHKKHKKDFENLRVIG